MRAPASQGSTLPPANVVHTTTVIMDSVSMVSIDNRLGACYLGYCTYGQWPFGQYLTYACGYVRWVLLHNFTLVIHFFTQRHYTVTQKGV